MEKNSILRIVAACFCGGTLTFLLLALVAPQMAWWTTLGITLSGALLGYVLPAPIRFARAIPGALRACAPILVTFLKEVVGMGVVLIEGVVWALTPKPVAWIALGIPALFGTMAIWGHGVFEDVPFAAMFVAVPYAFVIVFMCAAMPYGIMIMVAQTWSDRFDDEPPSWDKKRKPGYWQVRFRKELRQKGVAFSRTDGLWFAPIGWDTGVLYLLDATIGTLMRIIYKSSAFMYTKVLIPVMTVLFVEIPRAIWKVFCLVHSDIRLICMIDVPLGALSVYLALSLCGLFAEPLSRPELVGYSLLAGLTPLIFGVVNYGLIAKRWLGTTPEPQPARQG